MRKYKIKDLSLIQKLLALVAITVILGVFSLIYSTMSEEKKINSTVNQLMSISGIIDYIPKSEDVSNYDVMKTVINDMGFPDEKIRGNTMINDWGGVIYVEEKYRKNIKYNDIVYSGIPKNACFEVINRLSGMFPNVENSNEEMVNSDNIIGVTNFCNSNVNGVILFTTYYDDGSIPLPPKVIEKDKKNSLIKNSPKLGSLANNENGIIKDSTTVSSNMGELLIGGKSESEINEKNENLQSILIKDSTTVSSNMGGSTQSGDDKSNEEENF